MCANAWRMAERFGKIRTRTHREKLRWYADFGRFGRIWSLRGEPFESRAEAESILRAIQGDVARGTPKRQAVEKWLPASSQAHRVERWMALWLEDLEAQVESAERSPNYLREIRRWATPGLPAWTSSDTGAASSRRSTVVVISGERSETSWSARRPGTW